VCGDYLIAKAFRLLAENRLTSPAAHVVAAFVIGAESGIRTCAGQFQDVGLWPDEALTRETYERLVAGKTAAAIAGALMAGATLAGGDGQLLVALARYGEGVGLAFQIRDDVLDFIDVSTNGCHIDRKLSLPLIHAFEHGDYQSRILIRRFLEGEDVMGSEITKLLQTTGSLTSAQAVASSFAEEAIRLGKDVPHVPDVLEAFARYVVLREQ
jgi:geranylgeranyl pyrophosphate synthase